MAAGGQGRYASGFADLEDLRPRAADGAARLAGIEHAGVVPAAARPPRRRADRGTAARFALAGSDAEAGADALIGLAADALGTGRFGLSGRLLRLARKTIGDASPGRLPVRCGWVSAELAMFTGDGAAAVGHAERAVELAASTGSVRHAVKSDVVLAAALCSAGHVEASRRVADAALTATERLGFVPLTWALACLLEGVGSAVHPLERIAEIRDQSADTVRRRGGVWAER